ncbi:GHKL domain-containing protein [Butyrivibrio sp. YAB3001]|uniref:GHKL domain-containing protein n=1 Tax=Butyrivibrio sp. YAB3001 TaxID=1520812 RepID=UPI0008F628CF|nr:GHKL domain-containing protein [Butyrivibrio sp. YAB3001]SFC21195.1 GHKL domain-containing protein [Butyrivibrio sp. YAB3001]
MIRLIELEAILFLELCKYFTGYFISKKEISIRLKRSWAIIEAILLLIPVIIYKLDKGSDLDVYMVLYVSVIIGFVWIMDVPIRSKIWQTIILIFCISSIDSVNGNIIDRLGVLTDAEFEIQTIVTDLCTFFTLLVIFLIKYFINKLFKDKSEIFYNAFAQSSFIICGFFQCLNATIITSELSDKRSYYIIGLLSYLGVAFLGSQIWVVLDMNTRMKELIKEERILHSTQKEYYQSLLEREDETRKYRHDMTNHLMVMNALLNDNSIDDLKEYLGNLKEEFGTLRAKRYVTGNSVIDAISNYYLPVVYDFVDVKVRGSIPVDVKADEVSICTIYSNLVKNAIEELQRLKESGTNNLKLFIDFKAGEEFFSISIKNTMRENATFLGINTPTSKNDIRNHGIGLGNIKRTVEKEHGRIKIEKKDNMFIADVILPI